MTEHAAGGNDQRGSGSSGSSDSSDYPDGRDDTALAEDRRRVCRQSGALGRSRQNDAFQREVYRSIQSRRAGRGDLVQFDLLRGARVAVVRGEILVRADAVTDRRIEGMLTAYAFEASPVECLEGRVLRLRNPDLPVERLDDIARLIRMHGHEASVNHITPLHPLVKGEGGPEPTAAAPVYPPAFATGSTTSDPPVRVAVIDTGIAKEERTDGWLRGLVRDDDIDPLDALPSPDGLLDFAAGHGTFAAGIVAQVAPDAGLAIYRAVDSDGIGSEVDVACAMVRAADEGATILSLSLGAETIDDQPLLAIEVALEILHERHPDLLVVAAAGNSGNRRPVFPAASRSVVAVGALKDDLTPAGFSSRGHWVTCSTVGVGVVSTYVPGTESVELDPDPDTWGENPWAMWSGTSFAAPQISGAVARLCSEDPGVTPRQALAKLLDGRPRVPDFGRVVRILPGT